MQPVRPTDLAAALGVSPGRITQLKKAGRPTDSVAAAVEWRAKNGTRRRGPRVQIDFDDPQAPLQRARENVEYAWAGLLKARKSGARVLEAQKIYSDAEARAAALRHALEQYRAQSLELVNAAAARDEYGALVATLVTLLRALPAQACLAANPENPDLARAAIAAAVDRLRAAVAGSD